jgi:glucose-6-phosphate 1-epimerase
MTTTSAASTHAGIGGLPKLVLVAADGACADVYLHGAHVTSWIPAGTGDDRLFLSATSRWGEGEAIRGGVPVCFPQFADQGALAPHGFVRTTAWTLARAERLSTGAAQATLRISATPAMRALWPHAFTLALTVTVGANTLALELAATNEGGAPFQFTGALHTYLRVADVRRTFVRGLEGVHYRDKVLRRDDDVGAAPRLAVDRHLDRVYRAVPAVVAVEEPERTTEVRASGFRDTVVWNPGPERGAAMDDLEPGGYARMLCVEAAVASAPVIVAPGATWRGMQALAEHCRSSPK